MPTEQITSAATTPMAAEPFPVPAGDDCPVGMVEAAAPTPLDVPKPPASRFGSWLSAKPASNQGSEATATATTSMYGDLDPHPFDVIFAPNAANRRARLLDQRRGILEKEWLDQPRHLYTDVEVGQLGAAEPGIQQMALEAKATGCKSPVAALLLMSQALGSAPGIGEDEQSMRTPRRLVRALMIELAPQNVTEGMLVKQLVQLNNVASAALSRANESRESAQFANFANSGVKLMRASADHLMLLERLKRPRRRSMRVGSVQVADGGQAVIGDVHVQQRHD